MEYIILVSTLSLLALPLGSSAQEPLPPHCNKPTLRGYKGYPTLATPLPETCVEWKVLLVNKTHGEPAKHKAQPHRVLSKINTPNKVPAALLRYSRIED